MILAILRRFMCFGFHRYTWMWNSWDGSQNDNRDAHPTANRYPPDHATCKRCSKRYKPEKKPDNE